MMVLRRLAFASVVAAALVAPGPTPGLAADKVSFRTDWLFWAGHLPYVVGKHQGIFEKNGIDLELVQGSGSAASVKLTATGTHQMALASGTNAIMGRAEGLPIKVVGIVYQWDPWGSPTRRRASPIPRWSPRSRSTAWTPTGTFRSSTSSRGARPRRSPPGPPTSATS